ncbi:MAG: PEP-CTERM sorting domain-containing protein [Burkholderiales bacterium]|nr:PEP-CTERM sorting domain-containing protein [Burkholderiales bacterium]
MHGRLAALGYSLLTTTAPVPEPETWALWLAGLAALGVRRRRAMASA